MRIQLWFTAHLTDNTLVNCIIIYLTFVHFMRIIARFSQFAAKYCFISNFFLFSSTFHKKKHITGSNEEEWLTMEYTIGEWGQNGTDSGVWNEPSRVARCSLDSKVCSTSDNYFATMNFDFKKPLDAAFGVIGQMAFFIQGIGCPN